MFKIFDGRESFYQWDLNQKLIIDDSSINEVHFCNKTDACSLVCEVYEEQGLRLVNVPNILLTYDLPVRVYGYCNDYTKLGVVFSVKARTKPADYVYTETEVKTWERLEDSINNAIDALADAEAERVAAEDKRAATEAERVAAEAKRVNDFSSLANALKGAASGEAVAITDISPNTHEIKVTVSGVDDVSKVKVKQYRKNILQYPYYMVGDREQGGIVFTDNGDGSITANGTAERQAYYMLFRGLLPKGKYFISGVPSNSVKGATIYVANKSYSLWAEDKGGGVAFDVKIDEQIDIVINIAVGTTVNNITFKSMLIVGAAASAEYEAYTEPIIYNPSADGTIKGVTSLYPTTTLIADTAGALVEVEYNRDINKAFAELQQAIISLGGNI